MTTFRAGDSPATFIQLLKTMKVSPAAVAWVTRVNPKTVGHLFDKLSKVPGFDLQWAVFAWAHYHILFDDDLCDKVVDLLCTNARWAAVAHVLLVDPDPNEVEDPQILSEDQRARLISSAGDEMKQAQADNEAGLLADVALHHGGNK